VVGDCRSLQRACLLCVILGYISVVVTESQHSSELCQLRACSLNVRYGGERNKLALEQQVTRNN